METFSHPNESETRISKETKKDEALKTETLEICTKCGEPIAGGASHKCGELGELLKQYDTESSVSKLLAPIYNEAKSRWESGQYNKPLEIVIKEKSEIPQSGLEEMNVPPSE